MNSHVWALLRLALVSERNISAAPVLASYGCATTTYRRSSQRGFLSSNILSRTPHLGRAAGPPPLHGALRQCRPAALNFLSLPALVHIARSAITFPTCFPATWETSCPGLKSHYFSAMKRFLSRRKSPSVRLKFTTAISLCASRSAHASAPASTTAFVLVNTMKRRECAFTESNSFASSSSFGDAENRST